MHRSPPNGLIRRLRLLAHIFVLMAVLSLATATLTPSNRKQRGAAVTAPKPAAKVADVAASGPHELPLEERSAIEEEPLPLDILADHALYYRDTALRNFRGTVLGYVTPWNNHGYDVSKTFAPKFDWVSPVWLQIRVVGGKYKLEGANNVDGSWMNDVRQRSNKSAKFIPRILFDQFHDDDFQLLLGSPKRQQTIIKLMVDACQHHHFDGLTLDGLWTTLSHRVEDAILINLVKEIATALHKHQRLFVLVVPPHRHQMYDLFSAEHFRQLVDHVDAFSLMTYDYSSTQRPGANAPAKWIEEAVRHISPNGEARRRAKILIGLNMYGMDYTADGGGPLMADGYLRMLRLLQRDGRLQWSETEEETYFEVHDEQGRHFVFYPTLRSVQLRVQLAQRLGCGLSLWELGQGLDYFYDLL